MDDDKIQLDDDMVQFIIKAYCAQQNRFIRKFLHTILVMGMVVNTITGVCVGFVPAMIALLVFKGILLTAMTVWYCVNGWWT